MSKPAVIDSRRMARIEVITGEVVTVQGASADSLAAVFQEPVETVGYVAVETASGKVYINPAHVVRVFD